MINLKEATKIAERVAQKEIGENIGGSVLDDGEYFIFDYEDEVDIDPLAVSKETGKCIVYDPTEHDGFLTAKEIEI